MIYVIYSQMYNLLKTINDSAFIVSLQRSILKEI